MRKKAKANFEALALVNYGRLKGYESVAFIPCFTPDDKGRYGQQGFDDVCHGNVK